jgi:spore coat protein U-like protein
VRSCLLAVVVLLWLAPRPAQAQSCRNLTATPVAFGTYNVFATTDLTSTGTISYSCPPPLSPLVTLSASADGAYRPRKLLSFPNVGRLTYELYADAAATRVWGTGADGQVLPAGNAMVATVYGRVFAQQDAAIGSYFDFIVATFNF